ncbi:hypothetical protein HYFRA_00000910 [Hymenoscyphus fraxineus]|uniref:Uncharacterized protein n=1 Tax=Hymenoscyphus fraxineus TaxID=746836 RepID=A0A9N9KS82_9HELO|nr:hypothetical protein HYFRA_00000910 [Hymenoscyphus fraxineus]
MKTTKLREKKGTRSKHRKRSAAKENAVQPEYLLEMDFLGMAVDGSKEANQSKKTGNESLLEDFYCTNEELDRTSKQTYGERSLLFEEIDSVMIL